jgi:hypothetical protein
MAATFATYHTSGAKHPLLLDLLIREDYFTNRRQTSFSQFVEPYKALAND